MVDYGHHCSNCGATRDQIEDNVVPDCVSHFVRCKECSLMRQCFGDTCNECRENMKFSNHLSSESGLTEASFEEDTSFIFGFGAKKDP